MSWKEFTRNKWVRLAFWSVLYIAWVIWLGNYWWLLGLGIIFDLIVTKKVKWLFWKKEYKEGEKHNVWLDWLDAIIFAVVVVTFINIFFFQSFKIPSSSMENTLYTGDQLFVSKLAYGPRMPQTPLTIPFTHNTAFGKESYSTAIQKPYRRLKGFGHVERGDVVVFGFPNGDTVLTKAPAEDYHYWVRAAGKDYTLDRLGPIVVRPMDKKDHYVKRCVAVAGDTLSVKDGMVWINGAPQQVWPGVRLTYRVVTTGGTINRRILEDIGLSAEDIAFDARIPGYGWMPLTAEGVEKVKALSSVTEVTPNLETVPSRAGEIFPFTGNTRWTRDYFGPLWIPQAGATVDLTAENLPLYERIIRDYEHNDLRMDAEGGILINGEKAESYTFKQDYYFMMGDNRHNSLDSRYWGFVPEDHIVGAPSIIWLSIDAGKKFPNNIRWKRFFKIVRHS